MYKENLETYFLFCEITLFFCAVWHIETDVHFI